MRKVKCIVLGEEITEIRRGYYITVYYAYVDGSCSSREIGPFSECETDELHDAVEVLQRCVDKYSETGMREGSTYTDVEGYDRWFDCDENSKSIDTEYCPDDGCTEAEIESFDITYYKGNKRQKCTIVWEKESNG